MPSSVSRRPSHPPPSGLAASAYLLTPSTSPLPSSPSIAGRGIGKKKSWISDSADSRKPMSTTSASSHADHWDVSNSAGGGGLKRHEVVATHAGEQTMCDLYLVSGLPKNTSTWCNPSVSSDPSLAKLQHRPGAVGQWWRAEALGSNVTSDAARQSSLTGDGEDARAKLSAKALKFSFPREVEIIRSASQPPSTTHIFSFALPPAYSTVARPSSLRQAELNTYHGVTLTIYSLADKSKQAAIKKSLAEVAVAASNSGSSDFARFTGTGQVVEENGTYWLPYALTLVSKFPIYTLIGDYLKLSWAKFSRDVGKHSKQMALILQAPVPRHGGLVRLLVSDPSSPLRDSAGIELLGPMPQVNLDLGLRSVGWEMWPLFKVLSLENVLTILEIALSVEGKVVLVSEHPALVGLCVMTCRYLCELRGSWEGMSYPLVHARDVSLCLEDQGPYILGLDKESKYVCKPGPDVCIVDLDINFVSCPSPPAGVMTRTQRDKVLAKLVKGFGPTYGHEVGGIAVTSEFVEAYPGGRMRPFCETRSPTGGKDALSDERVEIPEWWDQSLALQVFDDFLASKQKKPGFFKRLSSSSLPKIKPLTESERIGRVAMRARTLKFVDSRDEMEGRLGRLSRRLAFLVHETESWKERFTEFELLTERLGVEANDPKARIEKERRESRRLSGQLGDRDKEKEVLQRKLEETETARTKALEQMESMSLALKRIETERDEMVANLDSHLDNALIRLSTDAAPGSNIPSRPATATSSSPRPSAFGRQTSPHLSAQTSLSKSMERHDSVDSSEGGSTRSNVKHKRFSATVRPLRATEDPLGGLDDKINTQSLDVEDRMAAIHLKLNLALDSITAHQNRMSVVGQDEAHSRESTSSPPPLSDDSSHDDDPTPVSDSSSSFVRERSTSKIQKGSQIISALTSMFTATPAEPHDFSRPSSPESDLVAQTPHPLIDSLNRLSGNTEASFVSANDGSGRQTEDEGSAEGTSSSSYSDNGDDDDDPTLHPTLCPDEDSGLTTPSATKPPYARPPSTTAVGGPRYQHLKLDSNASVRSGGSDDSDSTTVADRFTPVFVPTVVKKPKQRSSLQGDVDQAE